MSSTKRTAAAALAEFGRSLDQNCHNWHVAKLVGAGSDTPVYEAALASRLAAHEAQVRLREALRPEFESLADAFAALGAAWCGGGDPPIPDFLVVGAFRYALGRMTYVVGETAGWLVAHWHELPPAARAVIRRDLEAEFARDDAARAEGAAYRPLGMDMDRAEWERVSGLWAGGGGGEAEGGGQD